MAVQVGINGFGRIGRISFRAMMDRTKDPESPHEFEILAINDLGDPKALAMLLKYDTVQGPYAGTVEAGEDSLIVDGHTIKVTAERNPADLPWKKLGVDICLESTGFFTSEAEGDKPGYDSHLAAGARKVVISAPSKGRAKMIVMGVNDGDLKAGDDCISNASCTTNCLAPMAKVLNEDCGGIEKGLMTTVHAYTNDQKTSDQIHKDPRRARAAAANIIPTTTGAAKAVGKVLPKLDGKLTGISLRVPVPVGSVTDLVAVMSQDVSESDVNDAMRAAAEGPLKGILQYVTDPIVSSDIVRNPHSSIFDASWTQVIGGNLLKVLSWYDNEYGYSNRTADLIERIASL
ncbi:MAG: type I glyceraldehyde-3-phosphate dehydrogenase [Planctomycetota bacterium]|nr:MAG: type I glyceraldehyde-3-phosphate dehydrogenase [Planctomycetota bacterium]REK28508.1 MAG: type I glyceraldehyde-3-phosphate dehydrogenase [Planctomycetota bacterium]REK29072.1 MAG: type I glyceraldehyde-3-phosphate dehydrogenase [Planctomycetota bacterium]